MLEAYEGSLNDDEHSDYVFIKHSGGNGLAWGHADVALLLSKDDGDFTVQVLNTYAPDPKDFIRIGKETVFCTPPFNMAMISAQMVNITISGVTGSIL